MNKVLRRISLTDLFSVMCITVLRIRQRVTASPNLLRALALKTNAVVHVAQLEGRDALGGEGQPLLVTRPHRSGETLEVSSDGTAATED